MASLNRLRTRCNIRGGIPDITCPLCHLQTETAPHVFFKCYLTGAVWEIIRDWLHIPTNLGCLPQILKWMKRNIRGTGMKAARIRITLAASVYYLWRARNEILWKHTPFDTLGIVRTIKIHVYQSMYFHFPNAMLYFDHA
ncbi:hypothetical protein Dimus_039372 [Dionaea muscipula]